MTAIYDLGMSNGSAMIHDVDGPGHEYVEVVCNDKGETLRVTALPDTYRVAGSEPALRISIRDENGHMRQGPEFSRTYLLDVLCALTEIGRRLRA